MTKLGFQRIAMAALLATGTGCGGFHRVDGPEDAVPSDPVRITGSAPFEVRAGYPPAGTIAASCRVTEVRGILASVRGDTVRLTRADAMRAVEGAPRCPAIVAPMLLLSSVEGLRVEAYRFDPARVVLFAMVLGMVGFASFNPY